MTFRWVWEVLLWSIRFHRFPRMGCHVAVSAPTCWLGEPLRVNVEPTPRSKGPFRRKASGSVFRLVAHVVCGGDEAPTLNLNGRGYGSRASMKTTGALDKGPGKGLFVNRLAGTVFVQAGGHGRTSARLVDWQMA